MTSTLKNISSALRMWLVLFLLMSLVLLAGEYGKAIFDPSRSIHPEGSYQFPRGDCGDNYFLFIRLPGDLCLQRGDSAEKVEKAMEEVDPTIWKQPFDQASMRWDQVLFRALRDVLKWPIP